MYCQPQTYCSIVSQLFSVVRHVRHIGGIYSIYLIYVIYIIYDGKYTVICHIYANVYVNIYIICVIMIIYVNICHIRGHI